MLQTTATALAVKRTAGLHAVYTPFQDLQNTTPCKVLLANRQFRTAALPGQASPDKTHAAIGQTGQSLAPLYQLFYGKFVYHEAKYSDNKLYSQIMKTKIILPLLAAMALSLTACGGHFAKTQTTEQQNQPLDCTGLHMKKAQWHYTDANGLALDVTGTCHKGMKHGNFEFILDGKKVATTKFVKDQEEKTSCEATGEKTRDPLEKCLAKVNK